MATIPNLLSSLRLGLVPILLLLAWTGRSEAFLVCLVISLITDATDGYLARRLNAASELGARLDSWADFATYLSLPFCAWWLRPDVIRAEIVSLSVVIVSYLAPITIGFLKYGRLTSYHTWLAKSCAIAFAGIVILFFAGEPGWWWRCLAPLIAISGLEEIAITLVLKEWRANVPTFWHALQLRQSPGDASQRTALPPRTALDSSGDKSDSFNLSNADSK